MTPYYPIIDVEFLNLIDAIDGVWGVWEVVVTLEDGSTTDGQIQGDGVTWANETFEPNEPDEDWYS